MNNATYLGPELEVFEKAVNWRAYLRSRIGPHVKGNVLEVGAGIGTMTKTYLSALKVLTEPSPVTSWLALEPDPKLHGAITHMLSVDGYANFCRAQIGTLASIASDIRFDSILYIDVLEHIEDDRQEVTRAAALLNPGGRLIVMSPAHQGLFSPLDEAAGHFRRYSRAGLLNLTPPETSVVEAKYLDCVGMAASLANRMMLRQGTPSEGQIHLWDRGMIPLSRLLDPVFGYRLGKSILAVWEKT
jgi:hypothetical protein